MPIVIKSDGTPVTPVPTTGLTFSNVIEKVMSNVRSFTAASDAVTSLKGNMSPTDTSGQVDDLDVIGSGVIEIGDELMWVKAVDPASGSFTLLPKGRGWNGTTASAHAIGDTVISSPAYPRARIKQAINDVIRNLFPTVYTVQTDEFTYNNMIQLGWEIPADVEFVLDVRYKDYLGNWHRIRGREVERSVSGVTSGATLRITQPIPFDVLVQVVYAKQPVTLSAEGDLFATTGYEDRLGDLVVTGVMATVLPLMDLSRLQVTHAAADELDQPRPIGSAKAIADTFQRQFDKRVAVERDLLNKKYPARITITR
jgi:hypothetical protein